MKTIDESQCFVRTLCRVTFVAWSVILLAACQTSSPRLEGVALEGAPKLQMLECPEHDVYNFICVEIVFIDLTLDSTAVSCPFYTLFDGQINGVPDFSKADPSQRVLWRSVDVAGVRKTDVEYFIYFDPFIGRSKSTPRGRFRSPALKTGEDAPPSDVQFKYTVTADDLCPPLDPMIRIAN